MAIITTERLTKILSETQAVITECNSRGVHGSVEVNARLFENVLMELLRHRAAMLQSFGNSEQLNSQVIPDGWVMVPIEPTAEMQSAAAGVIRFDTTPINKLWTGNAVYRAMLAAAPQQEVK
ncbi:TPA: hypothetical protein LTW62_004380 [Enterobacter hormaechei]|nr:hypothetical protein [Enterobacter hormaechei]HBL8874959.1 hypothetical protein [Enterobacter hormaechei]HBL8915715.1 hypothetical protein [Enterobacter hormaechei]HBL8943081.1 hypothetical protein [Enterobacter hormaechei]HBL9103494.1 hypothetical protein [Enterobacter hormaechei]